MYLRDKVAIVTGAANGIGAGIVTEFVEEGAKHVRILDIDETAGVSLQNQLNEKYGANKVKFTKCDVSVDELLFGVFNEVKEELGYIDILINNAGVVSEGNSAEIRKEIEINLTATVNGTVKALELMGKHKGGRGGTVINISSIAGMLLISPMVFVYGATKSAVIHFSNSIGNAEYYSKTGVRVMTASLSATNTNIGQKLSTFDDENILIALDKFAKELPVQSIKSVARGIVEICIKGDSGSTWLIQNDEPPQNLTAIMTSKYDDMRAAIIG